MIFFADLFQPHGIDVQAGEQALLAFTYSTLYNMEMTWLQHLLAPAMQEHHMIIIPSGLANLYFLFVMDTHGPLDIAKQGSVCTFIYFTY